MWNPELEIRRSPLFIAVLTLLHCLVCVALYLIGGIAFMLLPVVVTAMVFNVFKHGFLVLPRSIRRVWLTPLGWHIELNNKAQLGPYKLHGVSRLDARFIRLSFQQSLFKRKHVLVTPAMIGADSFRRLQVYLRWSSGDEVIAH